MRNVARLKDIEIAEGETAALVFTLRDANEQALNLTGATVTISLLDTNYYQGEVFNPPYTRTPGTLGTVTYEVDAASVTVTTAASGIVTWTPLAAHVDTPGDYHYQFKMVFGDGSIRKYPIDPVNSVLRIHPAVA